MAEEQTITIPQLLLVLFIGGMAIRWFFFAGSSSRTSQSTLGVNNLRAREADVERIQQMFPQIARRTIMWDLQRNGGNVAATTERILNGRGLETVSQPNSTPPFSQTKNTDLYEAATDISTTAPGICVLLIHIYSRKQTTSARAISA